MAYGKGDFFHRDRDIDLDLLLGEYTNREFEIDLSDEELVTADRNKVTPRAKKKEKLKIRTNTIYVQSVIGSILQYILSVRPKLMILIAYGDVHI